ncbi:sulfite exporter TauE/SafE family protein [Fructobacillus papyrifericola]|uniref:Probable membrane transporter protein n=1 Tax=Fructobacillus papyrifericola TaxID=2713172 RepID=A0ABS5QTY9_9LACO|nr:sulfite exporter TauE/SafE family protein [Fructobacillus papyrifericola]MBS9336600.1 sulfite exporter TauE/SafE family protein [Fructobacillus papyrifericola]
MLSFFYLLIMSLFAGILNGIVGMAALTLYPVLLSLGISPVAANATITISQSGSGVGTLLSSLKELRQHWQQAIWIAVLNTAAGVVGALLLIHSSNADFKKVVPVFILIAAIMILLPKKAKQQGQKSAFVRFISWAGICLVGLYIGYFGAGSGLLMIAVLSRALNEKYATYNAIRNFATFLNNGVAGILFAFTMPVHWAVIPVLLIGLFAGGYIGPIVVRHVPQDKIERYVGIFALLLSAVLAWQAYF